MKSYVIDTSVILKWVIGDEQESDREKALELLKSWMEGRIELSAPGIWEYEAGNLLGRRFPGNALEKMDLLVNLEFSNISLTENMHRLCFDWMVKNGVTFYDACYLAVAVETNSILVTADLKFAEKMRRPETVCLLQDL